MQSRASMFSGKAVVITGAGGGIGRAHALAFAKEGAMVLVNDVGGGRDGTGSDHKMADDVVAEIEALGGKAAAHYESIDTMEGAKGLIDAAVAAFGRVDILVNNAGILRDKTLLKMDEDMWDPVIAVHLKGTFACSRAFARQVVEEGHGGRIINTTSYAGLKGNFGQSNYGAAKGGIYGLTVTNALELKSKGITVNAIAPMAKTRMTTDVDVIPDDMLAEHISPMVLFLASDRAAEITGKVFGIHGQQLFAYEMVMHKGVTKAGKELWTVPEIEERLAEIMGKAKAAPAAEVAPEAAAPEATAPADPVAEAFSLVPLGLVPEKATGKKFNIFFEIKGGTSHSIVLQDGKLQIHEGKHESPSCTVKSDADTIIGMFTGKVKPESAFMQGKISASNLGDMMAMSQVLSFKKAKEAMKARAAAAPQGPPASAAAPAPAALAAPAAAADPVSEAFSLVPLAFVEEKAAGKKFNIYFDIKGGTGHSILLRDGKLEIVAGQSDTPSCTVKTDADTIVGMFRGKIKPESAFMQGKISASNLGDMMTMGQVLSFKKAKEALEKGAVAPAPAAAPTGAPTTAPPAPVASDPVAEAFSMVPLAFVEERGAGKKFNIYFEVKGGSNHSILLQDSKLEVVAGQSGSPSCTVKTDADTIVGMFGGKIKPESAFMQGKISANNLGDMMTMGQVLSFKKAKEALEKRAAAGAAPAAAQPAAAQPAAPAPAATLAASKDPVAEAFSALPHGFKSEKAGGWKSTVHFEIKGGTDHTLMVEDGAAKVEAGKVGEANCIIKTDAETISGLLQGKVDGQRAFMQGKISATNMGVLMKFSQYFDFKARPKPVAAPPPAPEKEVDRTALIGRKYDGGVTLVKPEHMIEYAKAVNANDPIYLDTNRDGGILAFPIFPVRLFNESLYKIATDQELELDLVRLVHGKQDMRFHKAVRPNDLLNVRAEISDVKEKDTGTAVDCRVYAYSEGELAVEAISTLFVRGRPGRKTVSGEGSSAKLMEDSSRGDRPLVLNESFDVDADQATRYADASLDRNPIHLDEKVARGAGLPGVILHGLCTMAMSLRPFVQQLAAGDPMRVKRFSVRFSKPVFPGDTLTVEAWKLEDKDGQSSYGFEVKNQKDVPVISSGIAELA